MKQNVRHWDLSYGEIIEVSRNMKTGTIKSALINSYILDTTRNLIKSGAKKVTIKIRMN